MDKETAFELLDLSVVHLLQTPEWCEQVDRALGYVPVLERGDVVAIMGGAHQTTTGINAEEVIQVLKIVCQVAGFACPIIENM